jgi:4-carboxymuconolactone decarboxylase
LSAQAQERFLPLRPEQLSPEQKKAADEIAAGPRKSVIHPYIELLRSPELARRLQKVGEYIRYESVLPHRLSEFAILITAREWSSQFEWYTHYPLAMNAGLSPETAAELAAGKRPSHMQPDEALVYTISLRLHRDKANIPDDLFQDGVAKLGEQGLVDLIALNGYYDLMAMALSSTRVGVPAGERSPLPDLK